MSLPAHGQPRKVWIVAAHFPPSNLASVHRARLIANHLHEHGWEVTVLCVAPEFYEEALDPDLEKLVAPSVRILRVPAISQSFARPLGWGDLGIRGWPYLYRALQDGAQQRAFDLLHITIPSNYQALLGSTLFRKYRIPYIIDYIDPWVHQSDLGDRVLSKAWFSQFLANRLEPIAVKNASGIAGVTEGYFREVVRRNPHLSNVPRCAFQYGCSSFDHTQAQELHIPSRRLEKNPAIEQIVYAGALLPKAIEPMKCFLKALAITNQKQLRSKPLHLVCIGTGSSPNDPEGFRVKSLAHDVGATEWVKEYPERHPYLEVLSTLSQADGILVVGSTEAHYSPSKVFQAVLAKRPLLALLHNESEAVSILQKSKAGTAITFPTNLNADALTAQCIEALKAWEFDRALSLDLKYFESFDARLISGKVAEFYEQVLKFHHEERQ
jgi:glycosyltransferase involved in cell wall biosynthesis